MASMFSLTLTTWLARRVNSDPSICCITLKQSHSQFLFVCGFVCAGFCSTLVSNLVLSQNSCASTFGQNSLVFCCKLAQHNSPLSRYLLGVNALFWTAPSPFNSSCCALHFAHILVFVAPRNWRFPGAHLWGRGWVTPGSPHWVPGFHLIHHSTAL